MSSSSYSTPRNILWNIMMILQSCLTTSYLLQSTQRHTTISPFHISPTKMYAFPRRNLFETLTTVDHRNCHRNHPSQLLSNKSSLFLTKKHDDIDYNVGISTSGKEPDVTAPQQLINDDEIKNNIATIEDHNTKSILDSSRVKSFTKLIDKIKQYLSASTSTSTEDLKSKRPPLEIEDSNLLFYDVFLIVNLSVSISFWVVHRLSFTYITPAFSEGSLFSLLWIVSGLYNGSFLYSATTGHYDMSKKENLTTGKGGPGAAALLGLNTFVSASSLRILLALIIAFVEHRPVGVTDGEELMPLEITLGLILMSTWRMLHSIYVRQF